MTGRVWGGGWWGVGAAPTPNPPLLFEPCKVAESFAHCVCKWGGGVLQKYEEPESPNEGTCLRYMMTGFAKSGDVLEIYDEPDSPSKRGVFKIYDDSGIAK